MPIALNSNLFKNAAINKLFFISLDQDYTIRFLSMAFWALKQKEVRHMMYELSSQFIM